MLFRGLSFSAVDGGSGVQVIPRQRRGKTTPAGCLLRPAGDMPGRRRGVLVLRRVRDSLNRSPLWIGHQPGIKLCLTARENLHLPPWRRRRARPPGVLACSTGWRGI